MANNSFKLNVVDTKGNVRSIETEGQMKVSTLKEQISIEHGLNFEDCELFFVNQKMKDEFKVELYELDGKAINMIPKLKRVRKPHCERLKAKPKVMCAINHFKILNNIFDIQPIVRVTKQQSGKKFLVKFNYTNKAEEVATDSVAEAKDSYGESILRGLLQVKASNPVQAEKQIRANQMMAAYKYKLNCNKPR